MNPRTFFSKADQLRIENAIVEAEKQTSGEIRLHIQSQTKGNVMDAAVDAFYRLEMNNTALRNGVLFYLSINDHQFAVIGDSGINKLVPSDFWDSIYQGIVSYFKQGLYADGLVWAISQAGIQLSSFFPLEKGDTNELCNDISFEQNNK
jgi:uncharacterized membrane protein